MENFGNFNLKSFGMFEMKFWMRKNIEVITMRRLNCKVKSLINPLYDKKDGH